MLGGLLCGNRREDPPKSLDFPSRMGYVRFRTFVSLIIARRYYEPPTNTHQSHLRVLSSYMTFSLSKNVYIHCNNYKDNNNAIIPDEQIILEDEFKIIFIYIEAETLAEIKFEFVF